MKRLIFCLIILTACGPKERFQVPAWPPIVNTPFERALSEPIRGIDALGLAKLDAQYIGASLPQNSAIGALAGTFGDIRPNLAVILATGKIKAARTHLIDGTVSNHACTGNVTKLSFLSKKAQIMRAFAASYPNVSWYASPVLEHGCKNQALVNSWYKILQKAWPGVIPVCSSNGQGFCPPGILKENHGGGKGDITSNDGISIFDSDSVNFRNSGRILVLGWANCMNGRVTGEHLGDPIPLPPNRKNWCSHDEIDQIVRLLRTPEPKPNFQCKDILPPNISKPRSENYGIGHGDSRQNKPMLILNTKVSRFSIQKGNGQEIGCFQYYGTYAGGGYRYYEGNCSGKNPIELMDMLGSEWGKIISGNLCYNWNAIRRLGVFR